MHLTATLHVILSQYVAAQQQLAPYNRSSAKTALCAPATHSTGYRRVARYRYVGVLCLGAPSSKAARLARVTRFVPYNESIASSYSCSAPPNVFFSDS